MTVDLRNGVPAGQLVGMEWRKSSRSGAVGNCVELAWSQQEVVAVRNSRNPGGPALVFSAAGLVGLLTALRK